jgi:hypothetical protein
MKGDKTPQGLRRTRRVIMHHIDAGHGSPNWAKFECQRCGHTEEDFQVSNAELWGGRPCPKCNGGDRNHKKRKPSTKEVASLQRQLERARSALKVIHTWASFRGGELLTPRDTVNLCNKALEESQ